MAAAASLISVTLKLEGFECSDGTPLEQLIRKWAGEGENAWSWRRTETGFEIDLPVRAVADRG